MWVIKCNQEEETANSITIDGSVPYRLIVFVDTDPWEKTRYNTLVLVLLPFSLRPLWWKPRNGRIKQRGIRVLVRPCRRLMIYPGSFLEGSRPGGIRSARDQSAEREQSR